jgi:hypothetical protein
VKRLFFACASLVILTAAQGIPSAEAQNRYGRYPSETMLVAPDGSILDYEPDRRDVIISRDGMGRRVLIDHFGNVVATEIRGETYRPNQRQEYPPVPGGYRSLRDSGGYQQGAGGYRDYREYRPGEPGAVTGGIPGTRLGHPHAARRPGPPRRLIRAIRRRLRSNRTSGRRKRFCRRSRSLPSPRSRRPRSQHFRSSWTAKASRPA